jgi:hypothetical protein
MRSRLVYLIKTFLSLALLAVFAASLLSSLYIHVSYASGMPHSPDPQGGRVFQMTVSHDTVVYVTSNEYHRADFILNKFFFAGALCLIAVLVIQAYWK